MRKIILFILSMAMLSGGLYVVIVEVLYAHTIYLRFVFGGGILALVGVYLLWADFVAPRLGIKTWED